MTSPRTRQESRALFRVVRQVGAEDLTDPELRRWLDREFQPGRAPRTEYVHSATDGSGGIRLVGAVDQYGQDLQDQRPHKADDALVFLAMNSTCPVVNLTGRTSLAHAWPLFFSHFPQGRIVIAKVAQRWWNLIGQGQAQLAESTGYAQEFPLGHPQEETGFQSEYLPFAALRLFAFGLPRTCLATIAYLPLGLLYLYLPDRALGYSQLLDTSSLYGHLLHSLNDAMDDGRTYLSPRGPKSAPHAARVQPLQWMPYLDWLIAVLADRMADLLRIPSPAGRELLGMTVGRAICDALLSTSSDLAYVSKVFFFSCLDKIANVMCQTGMGADETKNWQRLLDVAFLRNHVLPVVASIPGPAGTEFQNTVEWCVSLLDDSGLTPLDLRDLRNTHHGYGLKPQAVERMLRKGGGLSNDLPLLSVPLVLWTLTQPWKHAT